MKTLTETMRSTIDSMNGVTESHSGAELDQLRNAYYKLGDVFAVCEKLGCNSDTINYLNQAHESLGLELREFESKSEVGREPSWPRW
jgi:hypothetical protein